jgi:hypothetical protein
MDDQRDDYAENDRPPRWWRRRPKLVLALALLGATILVAVVICMFGQAILTELFSDPEYRR